ncbi:hypothetical protein FIBSPDRAFT_929893 [Athelia psychrophila]|uniref:Carbamoyl phosphate synthase ATP-binding domain-containing protein n=1 Tax=Athelia psychrophila TaxID=1759441 RepID=A0A166MW22_9AGAM|nr:hypothetical protein FIBSPDRAFT_929893 [Fibularhizoctonia sp. CBS 109695]
MDACPCPGPDRGRCHGDGATYANYNAACSSGFSEGCLDGALHHLPPSHENQLSPTRRLDEDGTRTFEYLVNFHTGERVFLEINPRIQVKHTVTAEIASLDLVRIWLVLFTTILASLDITLASISPPQSCGVRLRLTAEDPAKDFRLSAELHRVARGAWCPRRCVAFRGLFAVGEDRGGARAGFGGDNAEGGACLREISIGNGNEERGEDEWGGWWQVMAHSAWERRGRIGTGFIVRQAWIGRRESTPGGDLGLAGNAAWRDISSRPIPAWIQKHLRREEACLDTRLHRVQRLSHTSLRHASKHLLAFPARIALKQGQSPASVSAGAFDLADPNDGTQVAAPPMGKIVELHLAV